MSPARRHASTTAAISFAALTLATLVAGCSSSDDTAAEGTTTASAAASTAAPEVAPTAAPTTAAPTTAAPTTAAPTTAAPTTEAPRPSIRGERYCEILLVRPIDGNLVADVYNTFPLNDCPAEQWAALDVAAIAAAEGVPIAFPNGPRYWLMDGVEKVNADPAELPRKTFGELEMYLQASVVVGPVGGGLPGPYTPSEVSRSTIFTFDAGSTVHELIAADGTTYVMQTWSQQTVPDLSEADLDDLGTRLTLPEGWTYQSRVLTEPLQVITVDEPAHVLMDDLGNSYSQRTD
jgi:hypothetical protein